MHCTLITQRLSRRALLFAAAGFSAFFLAFALVSQYGFGLFPCELCIKQRIPYALMIPLALPFTLRRFSERARGRVVALCLLLFMADALIAFYHAGVELHWLPGPSSCTASTEPQTLEEMRRALLEAELVSCDQPMVHVLGLSMAAWNGLAALGSAVLMGLGLCCIRNKERV